MNGASELILLHLFLSSPGVSEPELRVPRLRDLGGYVASHCSRLGQIIL